MVQAAANWDAVWLGSWVSPTMTATSSWRSGQGQRPFDAGTGAPLGTSVCLHEFGFTQSLFNFYERPLSEELWDAQVRAIREIADKESCVIVGRNADYILREFDHCLRVFVHADRNWRLLHMRKLMPDTPFDQLEVDMDKADRAAKITASSIPAVCMATAATTI